MIYYNFIKPFGNKANPLSIDAITTNFPESNFLELM